MGGEIYQFVRIGKGCLSYMIVSNGEAALIDAIRMTDIYSNFAANIGANITHVFDTPFMQIILLVEESLLKKRMQHTGCRQKMQQR
jgi:hypothetical protein